MTPELRDAWIDALRSGDYKQASGRLETPEGFCCMGVLHVRRVVSRADLHPSLHRATLICRPST
jgi:hypothetical protein